MDTFAYPHIVLQQPAWIDLDFHDDVSIWMCEFGVTETALREAVHQVGRTPGAVRALLLQGQRVSSGEKAPLH